MPETPATNAPAGPPKDFLLEWYKLHRAHELELNKATLAYELELAKLLVLLNGAAAGAFLTLTGTIWKEGTHPAFDWIAVAIALWLFGLLAAAIATDVAYRAQSEFTRAYRLRRQGEELRQISGMGIAPIHLGISSNDPTSDATRAQALAVLWSGSVVYFRYLAVLLFLLGGGSALFALYPPLTSAGSTTETSQGQTSPGQTAPGQAAPGQKSKK